MRIYTVFLVFISVVLSSIAGADVNPGFREAWRTDSSLKQPESLVYDISRRSIYVSNINGNPSDKDQNGFISLVSTHGEIEKLEWIKGLNAPKGMALRGSQLFVADIDQLIVIDVEKAEVIKRFDADSTSFLNDVAIGSDGTVFVTDTANNRIYYLNYGVFSVWLEDLKLESPNGIYVGNNKLYIGSWGVPEANWETKVPGHILEIGLNTKIISDYGKNSPIGNLDGIARFAEDTFIVSDWMNGDVLLVKDDGSVSRVLDLPPGSADLLYSRLLGLIIIPSMHDGMLRAYSTR